ncbi:MAG TPA: ATP-binding protein [Longimicrobium sp.]|jgi:hypothetical protein
MTTTRRPAAPAAATTTAAKKAGDDDRVPLFLGSSGLRSLRDSGFHFSAALGEPIDNSLESKANRISVVLEDGTMPSGRKGIARVIIADDGTGMEDTVLRRYLQIGFSTRYMSTKTIGKYGVGAKLAALSVAQRIDVWSRTKPNAPWRHMHLDLEELEKAEEAGEEIFLGEPDELAFPAGVKEYVPAGTGTVVVWSKVDRLEEGRRARDTGRLRAEVEREIARMFRNFLEGGIRIEVNGKALLPFDPLFLMEGTYNDAVLTKEYPEPDQPTPKAGGAAADAKVRHFAPELIADENIPVGNSFARLRVTLYPREVLRERFKGGDELAKRLNIPGSEGVISFVRLDREINYTLVPRIFPSAVREFDRFIGIEVAFRPELDSYFGVRNVKRGVEPEDQLRDEIRTRLSRYVNTARKRLKAVWAAADTAQHKGEHDQVLKAVADADRTLPKGRVTKPADQDSEGLLRQMATDVGQETEAGVSRYVEQHRTLPFVLESMDFPGNSFIEVQHTSEQTLIRLNVRHRFYKELWGPLRKIVDAAEGTYTEDIVEMASRGIEALTLLVLAYGKAESMQTNPHELYDELRDYWGIFLNQFMSKVRDVI